MGEKSREKYTKITGKGEVEGRWKEERKMEESKEGWKKKGRKKRGYRRQEVIPI